MTRRALRSRTAVVRILVSSAVERMARLSVQFGVCPIRRLHGIIKNGGQTATEALLCSGYVYIILFKNEDVNGNSTNLKSSMFLTR